MQFLSLTVEVVSRQIKVSEPGTFLLDSLVTERGNW